MSLILKVRLEMERVYLHTGVVYACVEIEYDLCFEYGRLLNRRDENSTILHPKRTLKVTN